jgi:competence protein ComEC
MRQRPLVVPAIALLCGTVVAGRLLVPLIPVTCLTGLLALCAFRRRRHRILLPILVALACLAAGATVRTIRSCLVPAGHLSRLLNSGWHPPEAAVPIVGLIRRSPEKTLEGYHLFVDVERIGVEKRRVRGRIRLTVPPIPDGAGDRMPTTGDRIRLHARLWKVRPFGNPGGFDYGAYLARDGIILLGSVKSALLIRIEGSSGSGWPRPVSGLRSWCDSELEELFPDRPDTRGLLKAILLGLRLELRVGDRRLLQEGGLYHLIAISGLHIGFWLWLWWWVLLRLRVPERLAAILTLPLLLIFPAFFGTRHSVLRAVVMAGPILAGRVLFRRSDPWNGLRNGWRRPGMTKCMLAVSIATQATTFPLTAMHFHRVTPIAILLNLVAIPAAAMLLGGGLLALAASAIHPGLARLPVLVLNAIEDGLFPVIRMVVSVPGSSFRVPSPPLSLLVLYYMTLGGAAATERWGCRRHWRQLGRWTGLCAAILILFPGNRTTADPELRIRILDVSQGDAIVVDFPGGRRLLIDAGGLFRSSFDIGENVVSPALWRSGTGSITVVAGTHPHRDHIGGLEAILRNFRVGEYWPPVGAGGSAIGRRLRQAASNRGIPVRSVRRGDRIWMGGARIDILHPKSAVSLAAGDNPNEISQVVRIRYRHRVFLLTGDIEAVAEQALLANRSALRSDVLKVPHHGGRESTTESFLSAVGPRVGVISSGRTNPWGHPSGEVLRRLRRHRVAVFRTDRKGAVTLSSDGCRLQVVSFAAGPEIEFPCGGRAGESGPEP